MEQYTDILYDDDLTDSSGEYDDSYYTGAEDLFDYTPDEESPISRLKSLVLSIDWEITDDVLMEFNEELVDLKDIWAGEKINLVYVQALEKLSKYIYQRKAESHPSAIKLLLTLYHNLEKIVISEELSDNEKKAILLEDVKRFEDLKSHLKTPGNKTVQGTSKPVVEEKKLPEKVGEESELINLKAIVLGIDWEITDDDLSALRKEVVRLEKLYAGSRPKLILLQGIGTIGAYIKVKKSDAHAEAFKVLHLFFDSLEEIVDTPMSVEKEKAILFPAVDKFNEFKSLLGETISPEKINRANENHASERSGQVSGTITPAFSDLPEDEVKGFQADEEASALGIENPDKVNDHVANFFGEDSFVDERPPTQQSEEQLDQELTEVAESEIEVVDKNIALQGVDVEEDDEDDDAVADPHAEKTELAPALSFEEEITEGVTQSDDDAELVTSDVEEGIEAAEEEAVKVTFFDDGVDEVVADFSSIDKNVALQGVDVESEADDDSDEDALPVVEGQLAPALVDNDEVSIYNAENLNKVVETEGLDDEIAETVLDFFEEESPAELAAADLVEDIEKTPLALDDDHSDKSELEESISSDAGELHADLDNAAPASHDDFESAGDTVPSEVAEEEFEDDISSDIESQLDDFFGGDDFATDDSANEMFASLELGEDESQLEDEVNKDVEGEDVVFELVEEAIDSKEIGDESPDTDDVVTVASLSGEEQIEPVVEETVSDTKASEGIDKSTENVESSEIGEFDNLDACIESVGLELEDKVLEGLFEELNLLDGKFSGNPLEKTFLHLLRTIAIHIERFRYEAGSNAYELLKSVFDALKLSQTENEQKEELLFAETVKILDWQQEIISNDSSKSLDKAKVAEPMFVQELGSDQMTFEDEVLADSKAEHTNSEFQTPANLKDEISSLRKSLQDEINELKKGRKEG